MCESVSQDALERASGGKRRTREVVTKLQHALLARADVKDGELARGGAHTREDEVRVRGDLRDGHDRAVQQGLPRRCHAVEVIGEDLQGVEESVESSLRARAQRNEGGRRTRLSLPPETTQSWCTMGAMLVIMDECSERMLAVLMSCVARDLVHRKSLW